MTTELLGDERKQAIAAFIEKHGVKRCPTACAVPTQASLTAADRAALRDYALGKERARRAKVIARIHALGLPASSLPLSADGERQG
jgi:3-methyladenine DNA glycosylase/8-oxoguanine DNA glycosylase